MLAKYGPRTAGNTPSDEPTFQRVEILKHNINEERESRTPEGFVHVKTIEMEEVNISSDVSEKRSGRSVPLRSLETPPYLDLFSRRALRVYPFG